MIRAVSPYRGIGNPEALRVRGGAALVSPTPHDAALVATPEESVLESLAARVPGAFYLAMLGLGTGGVLRVGQACSGLLAAVEGGHAAEVREWESYSYRG